MRSYVKIVAVSLALAVGASGCILSRAVDRAFIGATVKRPSSPDRLVTGIVLLPFTAVIDLATFPIQAIIIAIVGDNFPFGKDQDLTSTIVASLENDPRFQNLGQNEQKIAMLELEQLIKSGQMRGNAAALGEDGHWVLVPMTDEAKNQALARAGSTPEGLALR